jgi:S-methylmethionine-dependent homocysteine/selenocysteine methylase
MQSSKYRHRLPQLGQALFATDGGLETTLIFHDNLPLPHFAAFDLLKDEAGTAALRRYFEHYTRIALEHRIGIVLESATWRASADWGQKLGYEAQALADANRKSIGLLLEIRDQYETPTTPIVVSGAIGPRGDGYVADARMSAAQARGYHRAQIETFASTDADMVAAFTMNYIDEAIGIVAAAKAASMPVAISFTLETDGRLPSGDTLEHAIARTDDETGGYASYFMINCAHPTHFRHLLERGGAWLKRIRGVRANASKRSHAELNDSPDLDEGSPVELGAEYVDLRRLLPALSVAGGCCGTDHRHVDALCRALKAA